jgi:hypothetical protein
MSSKHLTAEQVASIIDYLQRVVPRGQTDADYLYHLLATLNKMLDNR